jgi:hypothetical protein
MTPQEYDVVWRQMSAEEVAVLTAVVSARPELRALLDGLAGAFVRHSADWILDVRARSDAPAVAVPDGPLTVRAFVPHRAGYRGEVLVWVEGGRLSGLEYAWVTDNPPTRWPRPDEIEVEVVGG